MESELNECRLISYMWNVIGMDQIEMREFKELVMVLIDENEGKRADNVRLMYGEKEGIEEFVEIWKMQCDGWRQGQSQYEEVSDTSIIKSKNGEETYRDK